MPAQKYDVIESAASQRERESADWPCYAWLTWQSAKDVWHVWCYENVSMKGNVRCVWMLVQWYNDGILSMQTYGYDNLLVKAKGGHTHLVMNIGEALAA